MRFSAGMYSIKHLPRSRTAVKNKPLLKSLLKPFLLGKALFAGHGTTDVFLVDVFFCDSDILHRSVPPISLCLLRHSDLFVLAAAYRIRPSPPIKRSFPQDSPAGTAESTGAHGNAHELHGIVVCRHPVGAELSAAFAAVDDGPLAALAYPDATGSMMPPQAYIPKQILFSSQAICRHRLRRRFTAIIKDIFSHHRPIRDIIQI